MTPCARFLGVAFYPAALVFVLPAASVPAEGA